MASGRVSSNHSLSSHPATRTRQVRHEARGVFNEGRDLGDENDNGEDDAGPLGDIKAPDLKLRNMAFEPAASGGAIVRKSYHGNGVKGHEHEHGHEVSDVAHDEDSAHEHLSQLFSGGGGRGRG